MIHFSFFYIHLNIMELEGFLSKGNNMYVYVIMGKHSACSETLNNISVLLEMHQSPEGQCFSWDNLQ